MYESESERRGAHAREASSKSSYPLSPERELHFGSEMSQRIDDSGVVVRCPHCDHVDATSLFMAGLPPLRDQDGQAVTYFKCGDCGGWIELLVEVYPRMPVTEDLL